MRPVVAFLILTVIVGTLALPHAHYSEMGAPTANPNYVVHHCRKLGKVCRNDFDCCGARTICRVRPGTGGLFSMTFQCDYRGFGFS
ncbi:hypothetical protein GE061_017819 [Apolygus lucorum]|uniref:WAP domain-containing protein n=1 Tax=Apolygus lucorum TaxID=248454 RepID=A0A6A4JH35_APOLU|nr:hypothetical protein GE061_017818 [Apolygus lucorum]KAF6206585.1 hypothetical protein GE061_017819 [Apolygus lucorum]